MPLLSATTLECPASSSFDTSGVSILCASDGSYDEDYASVVGYDEASGGTKDVASLLFLGVNSGPAVGSGEATAGLLYPSGYGGHHPGRG